MILRRLTDAFRKQDWFTVLVEIMIVVLGVFLGLQVNNWNAARQNRVEEARLVTQLLSDAENAVLSKQRFLAQTGERMDMLADALEIIQYGGLETTLSDEQCTVVWQSNIIIWPSSDIVTLDEILSTEGLGSLSNQDLRIALLEYQSGRREIAGNVNFLRAEFQNVVDHFPEAFTASIQPSDQSSQVQCNLPEIRGSAAVQNALVGNFTRSGIMMGQANREIGLIRSVIEQIEDAP
jgi:hypothetical protein